MSCAQCDLINEQRDVFIRSLPDEIMRNWLAIHAQQQ
jgi:hypothetical protein